MARKWLKHIHSPEDIRGLDFDQLCDLAEEIREEILRVTATNGGHLASSLGAVELAIALHYVFETPQDRLVWDVGHQTYAHKLLTGRADRFETIRRNGGLSGFPRRHESAYDAFGVGHASTSISAALGMALARDRKGEDYKVISITGDGAMTGGLCYEAVNHAGMVKPNLLIVLNDNAMSISKNVGALSNTFNRIVTTSFYNERRREIIDLIKRLPAGKRFLEMTNRVEESVKGLILPGIFFEELGVRYLGPIDAHNLEEMIPLLRKVQTFPGPIVLHTLSVKGKGRPYAEANPVKWHSPPLYFDSESGHAPPRKSGPPSHASVFVEALREEARRDTRLVAVTAAMLEGTGLVKFQEEFPRRTYDVGIAEAHAVTMAAGMVCEGLRPFVCVYSSFLQRSFDQLIHDVALQGLPVKFVLDRAGLVGEDGPTHHGVFDLSYLRMIPEMIVMAPASLPELRDMTRTAARYEEGPVAVRFPRGSGLSQLDEGDRRGRVIPIGKGELLRHGEEVCLIGIGNMVAHAIQAADQLAREGLRVGVVNARFAKPLDGELLEQVARRYAHLVTVEDNALAGGFGSAVGEYLLRSQLDAHLWMIGVPDRFVEHGSLETLYQRCGLLPGQIAQRVRDLLSTGAPVHSLMEAGQAPKLAPEE